MTTPTDPHEDAFFRAGSEGTYEGGPQSLVPVRIEDWAEQAPPNLPTEETLERRRKLRRLVVGVVATLGAGLIVALPLRLVVKSADAASAGGAELARPSNTPPSNTPLSNTPPTEATAAIGVSPPPLPPAPERTAEEPQPAPPKAAPPATPRPSPTAARKASPRQPSLVREHQPGKAFAQFPGPHEPPTATFPN